MSSPSTKGREWIQFTEDGQALGLYVDVDTWPVTLWLSVSIPGSAKHATASAAVREVSPEGVADALEGMAQMLRSAMEHQALVAAGRKIQP